RTGRLVVPALAPGAVDQATSAGGEGREGLAQRLVRTEHPGIVRTLAFSPSTRRVRYENGIFLYRVERGRPRFLGPYGEV
ncbi:hypothetical protein I3W98_20240, partial [Streptomyces cavourensis]|nr:hypothetical protein [Streptomyces cavourensis]